LEGELSSTTEGTRDPRTAIAIGAIGLLLTLGSTIRLFAQTDDHSALAVVVWGVFALWLPVPYVWAVRRIRRLARLPSDTPAAVREELHASMVAYLTLGYGTAVFALSVIQMCVSR